MDIEPLTAREVLALHAKVIDVLRAELNRLRAEQIRRANARFGPLAPIGGSRLSTGHLERPLPPEPEDWASDGGDYSPLRRFVEVDLHRKWEK